MNITLTIIIAFSISLIVLYIILDLASILTFGQLCGKPLSFRQNVIEFYKTIKLINIKSFDDSFEVNTTTMNGTYILNSTSYYMKIIDINKVLLITKSSYQLGYTLLIYSRSNDNFIEDRIKITDAPALLYYWRYHKLDRLIKKTKCKFVESEDVNKIINDQYTIHNRDTKLKELLNGR